MSILTFPADLDALNSIGKHILSQAQAVGLPKKRAYKLRLAVDELVTNIINYGYAQTPGHNQISIELEADENKLTVTMVDTGIAYDPRDRQFDQSILSLEAEERPIGGLGIFLALQSVDEFTYEVKGDKNISCLVMNLDSADND
ncbi:MULTISPECIES: anti-sigma regulatory factor [unclassified Synechocystis]|uniref:ATP-binding protein n=1 Tax=unclassified Synechocystis TaxID=2640012 RepID=UPI00041E3B5E|nr:MULTISPECIES: anti-sigma regulatory factor [unclassified Synechocystis]AIE73640.1 Serine-protein kinase RsbW [Synechocystis sp. PCC 6714]MCT0255000.1 anti-sigma regulatory factor [Synechocystis sp. CS-94]